jgi:hypothetical protein
MEYALPDTVAVLVFDPLVRYTDTPFAAFVALPAALPSA